MFSSDPSNDDSTMHEDDDISFVDSPALRRTSRKTAGRRCRVIVEVDSSRKTSNKGNRPLPKKSFQFDATTIVQLERRINELEVENRRLKESLKDSQCVLEQTADKRPPTIIPATIEQGPGLSAIYGQECAKRQLQSIVKRLRDPSSETGLVTLCRGVLLHGPPGNGKTMIAKAVAQDARAYFVTLDVSTLGSQYYSE